VGYPFERSVRMHSAAGKRLSATIAAPVVFITALLGVKVVHVSRHKWPGGLVNPVVFITALLGVEVVHLSRHKWPGGLVN